MNVHLLLKMNEYSFIKGEKMIRNKIMIKQANQMMINKTGEQYFSGVLL